MKNLTLVKIGGDLMCDEGKLFASLEAFAKINGPKILIHGGGKMASDLAEKLGIDSPIVNGIRVTNRDTLKVASMVYAGLLNKQIVASLQALNQNAIGLCGADDNLILAERPQNTDVNYGFVGDVCKVNKDSLVNFIDQGKVLVFSAITHDGRGQLLNADTDEMATEIAIALNDEYQVKLIYSLDQMGVLINPCDEMSFLKSLDFQIYQEMKARDSIDTVLLPKLENAFRAFNNGVNVLIGDLWRISLDKYSGTELINS